MTLSSRSNRKRRGATTVETAMVISVALLFVFGIIEYGRYLFFLQTANAAVRDAARYAAAHTGDGTAIGNLNDSVSFDSSNTNYVKSYLAPSTTLRGIVNYQLGNARNNISNYNVNVYNADPDTGQSLGGSWTDSPFAGGIVVELTGTYSFFLPTFLRFSNASIPVTVKAMMTSEAN